MKIECYPTISHPPELVPGKPARGWMDAYASRHPYRCLPLTMANTTGWELLCPVGLTATWNGGPYVEDITIKADRTHPDFDYLVRSHFSHGVMTFQLGYLFRTPPGWRMWVMGAPNHEKDGIFPLTGLVETDWLPYTFTMNWLFTRPGSVRFEKNEPFCFITLVEDAKVAEFEVVRRQFNDNPELHDQMKAWSEHRTDFNRRIHFRDPEAVKEAWQKYYFRGQIPEEKGAAPPSHTNKRRMKAMRTR